MDDLKLTAKSEEEIPKPIQTDKNLAMTFIWNLDFKNVPSLH